MIISNGIDIVDIRRIKKIINKYNFRFKKKCFHHVEINKSDSRLKSIESYAKRYAAKEACAKALGTGIGQVVSFQDLTIRNNDNGKPHFIPSEKLRLYLLEKGINQAHLSISDESQNAIAFVVLEVNSKD